MNRRQSYLRRPFRVVLTRAGGTHEARIHVVFRQLLGHARENIVRLFFGELSAFVRSGALAGDLIHPAAIRPDAAPAAVSAVTATQEWSGMQLPVEALTCLLNMLEWLHHNEAPILEVQLSWDTPMLPAIANAAAFPAAWPRLGFALHVDDVGEPRFDIEVVFRERQPLEFLDQVLHEVGVWFTAVNRGAYGDDAIPPATCCLELTGEAVELTTERMVVYVDRFRANDAALNGLANVIERVHRKLVAVARVTLG